MAIVESSVQASEVRVQAVVLVLAMIVSFQYL